MTLKELREYHEAQADLFRAKQRAYGTRPSLKLWREMQAMHERAAKLLSEWLPKDTNPKETQVQVNPDWVVDCAEELVAKFDLGCSGTTITYNEEKAQAIIKKHAPK